MIKKFNHRILLYPTIILFLSLFGIFTNPTTIYSATYYVAKNGNDNNSGDKALPWLTIQKAAGTILSGDQVYIKQGIYKETVRPKNSGTQKKYITYQAYAGDEVIIDAEDGIRNDCIRIDNVRYLYFKSLKLQGGKYSGFNATASNNLILDNITAGPRNRLGIYFKNVTDSTIKNCEISYNQHGIYLNNPNNNITIENNHVSYSAPFLPVHDKWGHNITLQPSSNTSNFVNTNIQIINNEVHHAKVQGILVAHSRYVLVKGNYSHHNGATGIQIEGWIGETNKLINPPKNIIVEYNTCEYNSQGYTSETGMWVDDAEDVVVQYNIMRHNETGIKVTGSSRILVRKNLIYENDVGNLSGGIRISGTSKGQKGYNHTIVHNVLHKNCNSTNSHGDLRVGNAYYPEVLGTIVKNNIISEATGIYDLNIHYLTHILDYNDYYNTRNLSINWQGTSKTWSEYLSASGQDSHSITQNPLFTDPANSDFHLQTESPCIDKGTFLTTTTNSGTGTSLTVADARYFIDGYRLIESDLIKVGSNNPVKVINVNYSTNTITVDKSISWNKDDGVSYPYSSSTPDIGAYEYGETNIP